VSDPYAQAASLVAASIEFYGGPWDGKPMYVVGPISWQSCWYDCDDPNLIHVYRLARSEVNGKAIYKYEGIAK
jgi:hypothetical protein